MSKHPAARAEQCEWRCRMWRLGLGWLHCSFTAGIAMSLLLSESPSLFQIRPALAQDAEGLIQLHFRAVQAIAPSFYPSPVRAAWSPPPSPARAAWMRQTIAAPERRVLLAAAEGRLGGFAICAPEQGLMQALYVDPACTGLSLGQRLLGAAEEAMRQAGCARVTLKASLNALGFTRPWGIGWEGGAAAAGRWRGNGLPGDGQGSLAKCLASQYLALGRVGAEVFRATLQGTAERW